MQPHTSAANPAPSVPLPYLFLFAVGGGVLFSLLMRLSLNFNGGHIDEYDYLFVGKQLLSGGHWKSHFYIFGSDLNWYLLGIGDAWAGLTGARAISGIFGLLSLVGLYYFVRQLCGHKPLAWLSVALLSIQVGHIFISRFATYDIMALAFFSLSLAPLLLATQSSGKARYLPTLLAIGLFSLAVTSKYIVIVYFPALVLLALLASPRVGALFGVGVTAILATYAGWHWHDLQGLYRVQILGVHGENSSYLFIGKMELIYLALPLTLWLVAFGWQAFRRGKAIFHDATSRIMLLLLVFALPLVAYHLHGRNMISLYKHMVYASFFLSPVMAWLLFNLMQHFNFKWAVQAVTAGIVVGMLALNYQQLRDLENAYPDVRPVMEAMQTLPIDAQTTIASEDPYLMRYALFNQVRQPQIKELRWMDNNMDGKYENKDTLDALWDNKFNYVFLNNLLHPNLNQKLRGMMKTRGYEKVLDIPWQTNEIMSRQHKGNLELYKRTQAARIPVAEDAMFK